MNEFSLEQFETILKKSNHTLTHWSMPSLELSLEMVALGTYNLTCVRDNVKLFENNDDFYFQIHYDAPQRLIGLYVGTNDRGWYLETTDLIDSSEIILYIFKIVKERLGMMKEIFEREFHA